MEILQCNCYAVPELPPSRNPLHNCTVVAAAAAAGHDADGDGGYNDNTILLLILSSLAVVVCGVCWYFSV